jgi:plastocyanin domain-containing protein
MPTGVQEVSLIVSDYGFFPNRIFVTKDLPVKIFLSTPSKTTLCFMVDEWGVRKGVTPGKVEEISFVPEKLGNVRFYCPVKSIEGMITVREPFEAEPQRQIASSVLEPEPIEAIETPKHNEPKNAPQLRALIDNEGEDLPKETPQEN